MTKTPPSTEQINEVARKVYTALFGASPVVGYRFDNSLMLWDSRAFGIAAKFLTQSDLEVDQGLILPANKQEATRKLNALALRFYKVWNEHLQPPIRFDNSTYEADKIAWKLACISYGVSTGVLEINDMSIKDVLQNKADAEVQEAPPNQKKVTPGDTNFMEPSKTQPPSLASIVSTPVEVELATARERIRVLELREAEYRRALHKAQEAFLTLERNGGYRSVTASGEPSTLPPNCVLRAVIATATALSNTPDSEIIENGAMAKAQLEALLWLEKQGNAVVIKWVVNEWIVEYNNAVWQCDPRRGGLAGLALRIRSFYAGKTSMDEMETTTKP